MRIHRYDAAFLKVAMAERLADFGLIQGVIGGYIVSNEGAELIVREYAPAIRMREERARRARRCPEVVAEWEHQRVMRERRR